MTNTKQESEQQKNSLQQPESSAPLFSDSTDKAAEEFAESLVDALSLVDGLSGDVSTKDQQIAELQNENTELRDTLNEHKFWGIFAVVLVLNILAFSQLGILQCILIFLLEIIPLTHAAKKYGFEAVAEMLDTISAWAAKHISRNE